MPTVRQLFDFWHPYIIQNVSREVQVEEESEHYDELDCYRAIYIRRRGTNFPTVIGVVCQSHDFAECEDLALSATNEKLEQYGIENSPPLFCFFTSGTKIRFYRFGDAVRGAGRRWHTEWSCVSDPFSTLDAYQDQPVIQRYLVAAIENNQSELSRFHRQSR